MVDGLSKGVLKFGVVLYSLGASQAVAVPGAAISMIVAGIFKAKACRNGKRAITQVEDSLIGTDKIRISLERQNTNLKQCRKALAFAKFFTYGAIPFYGPFLGWKVLKPKL